MEGTRADVLIETLRADAQGTLPAWPWHLARLQRSAAALAFPPVPAGLQAQVCAAIQPGEARRMRVLFDRSGAVTVEAAPLTALDVPVQACLAEAVLGPQAVLDDSETLLQHKTTYRPWYDAATAWLAQHPACFDLLFLNTQGELCEGSRTNVYVRHQGEWLTPDTACGCLPGTQRAALLASGQVRVARLTLADLRTCDGVRLSNGLRGWFDAVVTTA